MRRAQLQEVEIITEGLEFPEGPVAMADGSVLVVEIDGGRLTRVDPATGKKATVAACGDGPNGAAIGPDGKVYICNNGGIGNRESVGRIQRVDLIDGSVEDLYVECDGRPLIAPNDLVFDSTGGFWFTDHGARGKRNAKLGGIFYAHSDGSMIREVLASLDAPNGIGLSPDEDVLYYSETLTARVIRRRIAAPGELEATNGTDVWAAIHNEPLDPWVVLGRLPGYALLDSMAIEAGGKVCVGTLLEGGITVLDPASTEIELLEVPEAMRDLMITNICFAGDDLTTAYLTGSQTGRLLGCRWPRPGLMLAFNA